MNLRVARKIVVIASVTTILAVLSLSLYFLLQPSQVSKEPTLESVPYYDEPVKIVSTEFYDFNLGGPVFNITVANIASKPISLLEIDLKSFAAPDQRNRTVWFSNVTLRNPLLPGQSTWIRWGVIGGGFDSTQSYSIPVKGQFVDGQWFQFTTTVRVTEPVRQQASSNPAVSNSTKIGSATLTLNLPKSAYKLARARRNSRSRVVTCLSTCLPFSLFKSKAFIPAYL